MEFKKGLIVAFLCAIAGNSSEDTLELAYDLVDKGYVPTDSKELEIYFPEFTRWWKYKKDVTYKTDFTKPYWTKRDMTEDEVEVSFCGEPYGDDEYESLNNYIDVQYSKMDQVNFITGEYGKECILLAAWAVAESNCDLYEFFASDYEEEWQEFLGELPGVKDEAEAAYWQAEADKIYWEREARKGNSEL